jgi:hypothetical protein
MKWISLTFLAAFAVWAVRVVGGDLAARKIYNSSIMTGLKLLGAGLLAAGAWTWLGYAGRSASFLNAAFYGLFAAHLFWSALAGVILWYAEVWPAGDAKFFILTAAALPLANPYLHNFPGYLFLTLLINIFVAAALWVLGSFFASGLRSGSPAAFFGGHWARLKERLSPPAAGSARLAAAAAALNVGLLFLLQQALAMEARGLLGRFFVRPDILFFFLFVLWGKAGDAFRSRAWTLASAVCYAAYLGAGYFLFPDRLWLVLGAAVTNMLKFGLLLFFGRFLLDLLLEGKDARYVTAAELKPGDMLSANAARQLKANPAFEGLFDDCFKDGLTDEQAAGLKEWLGKLKAPDPKVEIVAGRPFALWIFAGAALTLLLDRNIAGLLR